MLTTLTQQLKHTSQDILFFLKHPSDTPAETNKTGRIKALFLVLVIYLFINLILGSFLEALSKLGWYNTDSHAITNLVRSFPVWAFLLAGVIVIPFLEELVFRYGLRFKRGWISFIVMVLLLTAGGLAFYYLPLMGALAVMVGLMIGSVVYALKAGAISDYLERVWPRIYGITFYAVAVSFGLIHITNYTDFDYASAAVVLVPVLVAPQIIGGLLMGYMRVKYGFFWGYFLHAGHNAFFFVLGLAFMNGLEEKLNITNDTYTLKVEEHMLLAPTTKTNLVGKDSIAFINGNLNDVIYTLLQDENMILTLDRSKFELTTINLSFKNHAADANKRDSKKLILAQLQELYKFDIAYRKQEVIAWDLEIEDNSLLTPYVVEDTGSSTVLRDTDGITLVNVTREELLKTIATDFGVQIFSDQKAGTPENYDFKLPKSNFKQLKEELKAKYGLVLHQKVEQAEQALVEFKK